MVKRTILAFSTVIFFMIVISFSMPAEKVLRNTLESTWKAYLSASMSGKETELEKTMSSFRLAVMKNDLANAKRSLTPEMIKSIAEYSPDIIKAEFVTLMEKGPTAGLVYVKDSEEQDASGKPRVDFIFIKFVKESSGWKVDGAMNIGGPKFRDNGKRAAFNPSDLPPTYEIDGQVREAPKPVSFSDIAAYLDVSSYGYKTEVSVNGVEQVTTMNKSYSGLLKGGLRKGKNDVVIIMTKIEKNTTFKPQVTIRRILEDRAMKEVFKYEAPSKSEGKFTFTFTIDK